MNIAKLFAPLSEKLKQKYGNLKIGPKIMLFYALLLFFSIGVSGFLYQWINTRIMSRKVSEVAIQTLRSIGMNLDLLINTVNDYSKMVLANDNIQNILRYPGSATPRNQQTVTRYLIEITEATPLIESVYIFNNDGIKYAADKTGVKTPRFTRLNSVSWYYQVLREQGGFILRLNAAELFPFEARNNFVSLIRVINDINTQRPIGIMVMNISPQSFRQTYEGLTTWYNTRIILKDEHTQDIIRSRVNAPSVPIETLNVKHETQIILKAPHAPDSMKTPAEPPYILPDTFNYVGNREFNSMTSETNGSTHLYSYLRLKKYGWTIISVIPFNELTKESWLYSLIMVILILINCFLIFLGLVLIFRFITNPLNKLLKSMQGVEKGQFIPVEIRTGHDEIGRLKDGYNLMIREIQQLVARIIADQKIQRKAELDVLQAQIKPHFLYNTFDAISYLALAGRSAEVYQALKALGGYYRISLSKGREVIPLAAEIEIVKNYLIIQKVRYQDMFTATYDIDERVNQFQIPKLVLQPFVENALYHGIKPTGEPGIIAVGAAYHDTCITITVADNGVGISPAVIAQILNQAPGNTSAGFGIRGTMERLRIFYGAAAVVEITGRPGCGTAVTITIPVKDDPPHAE